MPKALIILDHLPSIIATWQTHYSANLSDLQCISTRVMSLTKGPVELLLDGYLRRSIYRWVVGRKLRPRPVD